MLYASNFIIGYGDMIDSIPQNDKIVLKRLNKANNDMITIEIKVFVFKSCSNVWAKITEATIVFAIREKENANDKLKIEVII